jgi:hypothetical protein
MYAENAGELKLMRHMKMANHGGVESLSGGFA